MFFVDPRSLRHESVSGARPGLEEAVSRHGADHAFPYAELERQLPWLLEGYPELHYRFGLPDGIDPVVLPALRRASSGRSGLAAPLKLVDGVVLDQLRLLKSAGEIGLLRRAGAISAEAHRLAMGAGRPGVHEYELEALVDATFRRSGGSGPGYDSIVGSGPNACVLHHTANDRTLGANELCLVDAGCRLGHYTADLTRTWPTSGRFSKPQRALYEVVLTAWEAGRGRLRAGESWETVEDAVRRALCRGLVRLGLLDGDVDEIIHEERYRRFFAHEVGHWLGLDVHDPGALYVDGAARRFRPGMVVALEPGLYVQPDDEEAPEAFRGLGVRIEDDLVVTDGEAEVLTPAPRTVAEIEAVTARAP